MNRSDLEKIVAIAEEGSMAKAAQRLYITQPALSKCLNRVEEELGEPLFLRRPNGLTRPSLILADEPTGNLDSKTTVEIMDIFHELHDAGNTIVLITHDDDVARQASRIVRIKDGQLTEVDA